MIQLVDGVGDLRTVTRTELLPVDGTKDEAVGIDVEDDESLSSSFRIRVSYLQCGGEFG